MRALSRVLVGLGAVVTGLAVTSTSSAAVGFTVAARVPAAVAGGGLACDATGTCILPGEAGTMAVGSGHNWKMVRLPKDDGLRLWVTDTACRATTCYIAAITRVQSHGVILSYRGGKFTMFRSAIQGVGFDSISCSSAGCMAVASDDTTWRRGTSAIYTTTDGSTWKLRFQELTKQRLGSVKCRNSSCYVESLTPLRVRPEIFRTTFADPARLQAMQVPSVGGKIVIEGSIACSRSTCYQPLRTEAGKSVLLIERAGVWTVDRNVPKETDPGQVACGTKRCVEGFTSDDKPGHYSGGVLTLSGTKLSVTTLPGYAVGGAAIDHGTVYLSAQTNASNRHGVILERATTR